MNPRLTNKKLVKALMDVKGLDMITITSTNVLVQVSNKFTPAKADELCKSVGHDMDAKAATKDGLNFIIFPRF